MGGHGDGRFGEDGGFNPIDRSGWRERVDKPQGRKGKMVEGNH